MTTPDPTPSCICAACHEQTAISTIAGKRFCATCAVLVKRAAIAKRDGYIQELRRMAEKALRRAA